MELSGTLNVFFKVSATKRLNIHQRNTLRQQCMIISDLKKTTRVLWSVMDILSAEPVDRKLLLKAPTRLICPNIVRIIIHPSTPKSR